MADNTYDSRDLGPPLLNSPISFSRRISWPAIFAGTVVVIAIQFFLATIGISIGAGTISPMQENAPFQGLGLGAGIWLALSALIALFAGGWVAGRGAHVLDKTDAALHGFITWGVALLLTTYLMTTMIGGLVSGAAGVLGKSISALGQGAGGVGRTLVQEGREYLDERGVTLNGIMNEVQTLLRQTEKPALQPENLRGTAAQAGREARGAAAGAARNPQAADTEASSLLERLMNRTDAASAAADKEALINIVVNRSGMSRQEATATVNRWDQTLKNAQQKFQQVQVVAEQKARQAGEKSARAVTKTAGWSALIMLLGSIAASLGGITAVRRKDEPYEPETFQKTAEARG